MSQSRGGKWMNRATFFLGVTEKGKEAGVPATIDSSIPVYMFAYENGYK